MLRKTWKPRKCDRHAIERYVHANGLNKIFAWANDPTSMAL
jgi:hypothetical protein